MILHVQKETVDFKFLNFVVVFFSFLGGYLLFGHQGEKRNNTGNFTIDSILSTVKKSLTYSRVIKFFKTSYQLHFLFS